MYIVCVLWFCGNTACCTYMVYTLCRRILATTSNDVVLVSQGHDLRHSMTCLTLCDTLKYLSCNRYAFNPIYNKDCAICMYMYMYMYSNKAKRALFVSASVLRLV